MSETRLLWRDVTKYRRDDQKREPQTFEAQAGPLRLVITRHIHHEPTDWVIHVGDERRVLSGNVSAMEARLYCETRAHEMARGVLKALGEVMS